MFGRYVSPGLQFGRGLRGYGNTRLDELRVQDLSHSAVEVTK
jgi:hypothetical protein